ncbi:hypothetical protein GGU11DRAFT_751310 [Lentinula aff. detonsa]|nr:hypothetical protein GGU11DRAFT_751310 [Lentinula aff. detonsa]
MFWMLDAPSTLSGGGGGGGGGAITCLSVTQLLRAIAKQLLADAVLHTLRPLHLLYSFRNPHGIRMATARRVPHFTQSLCSPITGFSMLASTLDCALSAAASPTWTPQENEMIYPCDSSAPGDSLAPGAPFFPELSHFILILEVPLQFVSVPCRRIAVETLLLPLALQIRVADMGQGSSEESTAESFYSESHSIEASATQAPSPPSADAQDLPNFAEIYPPPGLVVGPTVSGPTVLAPSPPSADAQDLSNFAEIYPPPGLVVGPTVLAPSPPSADAQDLPNFAEIYTPPGSVVGPAFSSLAVSGPTVSGPTVSGPMVSGPTVSGPTVSGPTVSAPEVLCISALASPPLPFPLLPGGFCEFAETSLGFDLFSAVKSSQGGRRRLLWDGIRNHQSVCDILRQAGCSNLKNLKGGYQLPSGKTIEYCNILQELGWGRQSFLHKLNSYNWCREFANSHCWDPALLPSKSAPEHPARVVLYTCHTSPFVPDRLPG